MDSRESTGPGLGETWAVHRQDDNGQHFVVQTCLSREEAERLVRAFEARGHKQVYWAEPASAPSAPSSCGSVE